MADKYKQFFTEADKDKSGYLTLDELTGILRSKGYKGSDAEIKSMFGASDASGDNKITLDEYLQAMGQIPPKVHEGAAWRNVFRSFDKDGSGKIDAKELQAVFKEAGKTMSEAECNRIIQLCDKDKSGSIDYEEFIAEMCGKK